MSVSDKTTEFKGGPGPPRQETRLDGIPAELKALPRWVCWRWKRLEKSGKWTKPPIRAKGLGAASVTDSAHWAGFTAAADALAANPGKPEKVAGVGFILGDGYAGVDLDGCRDPATGEVAGWASELLRLLDTYCEVSPSGTGVKALLKGACPPGSGHKRKYRGGVVEAYSEGRYFTTTGQRLEGFPAEVRECQDGFEEVMRRAGLLKAPDGEREAGGRKKEADRQNARPKGFKAGGVPADAPPEVLSDDELLRRMLAAKNGNAILKLINGDSSGHGSHSEADLALMSHLRFWTGGDRERVRAMFLSSGLGQREKAGREDYIERTLDKAMEGEVWRPCSGGASPPDAPPVASGGHSTPGTPHETDMGNATRLAKWHGDELRYVHAWESWLVWDNSRWRVDDTGEAVQRAKAVAARMYAEAAEEMRRIGQEMEGWHD